MTNLATRLKTRREQLRLSQEDVAARVREITGGTFKQQSYASLEAKPRASSRFLAEIAIALGCTTEWLITGKGSPPPDFDVWLTQKNQDHTHGLQQPKPVTTLPGGNHVYSGALVRRYPAIATMFHAKIVFDDTLAPLISSPFEAGGRQRIYAAIVPDDSMSPRFKPGETVFMRTGVWPSEYVLIQFRPKDPSEPVWGYIRYLVERRENSVILETHNPPTRYELQLDDVIAIDNVEGSMRKQPGG